MLTLIPTPIDEINLPHPKALELLKKASHSILAGESKTYILVEDMKPARRRWIRFGLDRRIIEHFIPFNEHTQKEIWPDLIGKLKSGGELFLMSDGGLPGLMDPGQNFINQCHKNGIRVTSTPFCNSISLALALSGLNHHQYLVRGFLPRTPKERSETLKEIFRYPHTQVLMDTPFRLKKLANELMEAGKRSKAGKREAFLGYELNGPEEKCWFGAVDKLGKGPGNWEKGEFVFIIGPALC